VLNRSTKIPFTPFQFPPSVTSSPSLIASLTVTTNNQPDNNQNLSHSKEAGKQITACMYCGSSTTATSETDMLTPISNLQEKKNLKRGF
jgi:hypothetical protein